MLTRPTLFLFFAMMICFATIESAYAQNVQGRASIGAQFSTLSLADAQDTSVGIGVRGSYPVARWIDADASFSFFPTDKFVNDSAQPGFTVQYDRRRIELLAGPKVGLRREHFGVFGKVRPGFTRLYDRGLGCTGEVCALALFVRPVYRTEFALDLGGVVELYPSDRLVARVDVGSTRIRHRSVAPPCTDCSTNNFATSFGVGWRF